MFQFQIIPYTLYFQFDAGTSRGILREKKTWFLRLTHSDFPERVGWGEAGPLGNLSPENLDTFESDLRDLSKWISNRLKISSFGWETMSAHWMQEWQGPWLPAAWFAWETAFLDWVNGGKQIICDAWFHSGQWSVPVNGLVWMNQRPEMEKQAEDKLASGYQAIKFKVGALDWEEELGLIRDFRLRHPHVSIRLDANGAWKHSEAMKKLEALQSLDIHSVEQPIAPNQINEMAHLCSTSPIPIALDEELIHKPEDFQKYSLLEQVLPAYLILKPTLLGGLGQCHQWIKLAEDQGINWWITSMLESNIGLNAISQLASQYRPVLPQGLGTGQLYRNNIPSPLNVKDGLMGYDPTDGWDFGSLALENQDKRNI